MRIRFVRRTEARRHLLLRVAEHLLIVAAALGCFYLVPITGDFFRLGSVIFVIVLAFLVLMVSRQLIKQARAGSDPSVRVRSLLFLLYPIVTVFALAYYALEIHNPNQFDGLVNRTDALYYTIVTLGTVGYGDVHAAAQAAKIITMGQIVFDLVVVGLLVGIAASRMMILTATNAESGLSVESEEGP
jgi:voltage-gated potassium channel Kch